MKFSTIFTMILAGLSLTPCFAQTNSNNPIEPYKRGRGVRDNKNGRSLYFYCFENAKDSQNCIKGRFAVVFDQNGKRDLLDNEADYGKVFYIGPNINVSNKNQLEIEWETRTKNEIIDAIYDRELKDWQFKPLEIKAKTIDRLFDLITRHSTEKPTVIVSPEVTEQFRTELEGIWFQDFTNWSRAFYFVRDTSTQKLSFFIRSFLNHSVTAIRCNSHEIDGTITLNAASKVVQLTCENKTIVKIILNGSLIDIDTSGLAKRLSPEEVEILHWLKP